MGRKKRTEDLEILVDDQDRDLVEQPRKFGPIRIGRVYYARRTHLVDGQWSIDYLHRLVAERMGIDHAPLIDHKDGNGLNCRRRNLRPANHGQNAANSKSRNPSSGYRGVYRHRPNSGRYRAQIGFDHKRRHLGIFTSAAEAALAYDQAAIELYGEFATLNFPHRGTEPDQEPIDRREQPAAPAPSVWSDDDEDPF